ncbi:hypothetical protein ACJX0J_030070, partial [Zea mays]
LVLLELLKCLMYMFLVSGSLGTWQVHRMGAGLDVNVQNIALFEYTFLDILRRCHPYKKIISMARTAKYHVWSYFYNVCLLLFFSWNTLCRLNNFGSFDFLHVNLFSGMELFVLVAYCFVDILLVEDGVEELLNEHDIWQ